VRPITPTKRVKIENKVRKALAGRLLITPADSMHVRIATGTNGTRQVTRVTMPRRSSPPASPDANALVSLPRRRQSRPEVPIRRADSTRMKLSSTPRVGTALLLKRLWVWLGVFATFYSHVVTDVLRRRDTQTRRAIHLRRIIERSGGTLVKIGQQMSLRLDILPVSYCEQLAMMRDKMPPFDTAAAITTIERSTGQPLRNMVSTFDPVAIESTSIACTYQAILRENGEKVAIKVRRPGIDAVFEADLRVLMLLVRWAETLTLIPPTYGAAFYGELHKTLLDELDFRRGARYEELFSRGARKAKKTYFTTRRIYYQYATEEVLVREFASGMWLWEVLASLENEDPDGLAYMQALHLNPRKIAKRLLFIHHWSIYEHLTFHATPSAANIIVGPDNHLTFVDFGANGHIRQSRRVLFRRFYQRQARQDIWGMAQAMIALLEPLPGRDLNTLAKEIEATYYDQLLASSSKRAHWSERTSAALWLAAFKVLRKYRIAAPIDVLLFVRATLLYDTLAARLWPSINYMKALRRYTRDFEQRQRKHGRKMLRQRLQHGLLTDAEVGALESLAATGSDLLFRLQRILNVPYDFAVIQLAIEKWVFAIMTVVQFIGRGLLVTIGGALIILGYAWLSGQPISLDTTTAQLMDSRLYWLCIVVLALLHIRILLFRLADKVRKD